MDATEKKLTKTTRTLYKQGTASITVDGDGEIDVDFPTYSPTREKLEDVRAVIEAFLLDE